MYSTTYNVNIVPGNVPINIHISQYDAGTRQFEFIPYSVPGEIDTSAVATVTLEATKPDGYGVVNVCTWDGSKATYTVQQQLAAVVGKVWSKLVFRGSNSEVLGSAAIIWTVDPAGLKDNAVISDSDIAQMEQWIEDLSDATAEALKAEGFAVGEQDGTAVASGSPYYHNNSKYYSEQSASSAGTAISFASMASTDAGAASGSATAASNSALAASGSATTASTNALIAEGYAVGKQNGTAVSSGTYYQNNAKYFSDRANVLYGHPFQAANAAAMTDTSKVYVYTGSETGYVNGNYYFYNGSSWVSGGAFNSTALNTDTTLSIPGAAADAAATGIVKGNVEAATDLMRTTSYTQTGYYINGSGGITSNANWTTFYMIPVNSPYIHVSGKFSKLSTGAKNNIWCYDANGSSLGGLWGTAATANENDEDVTLLAGTKYISITTGNGNIGKGHVFANMTESLAALDKKYEYIKGQGYNGSIWKSDNRGYPGGLPTGTIVTVTPISSSDTTATAFSVYGVTPNSDAILLGRPKFGETLQVVTQEEYTRIQMTLYPTANTASMIFQYGQVSYVDKLHTTYQPYASQICKIFRKVVCCGDSYTSGYIVDSENTAHPTNEDYAYPHYMETLTGNTWVNCGKSGANVLTWMTESRGLPKAQASGRAQAYVIGLGINDCQTGTDRYVPVGTADDIGSTIPTTYYGGLSKIIRELATISPHAHIFVNTNPNIAFPNYDCAAYNTAVRTIVSTYSGTYNVHLIDLDAIKGLYQYSSIINDMHSGHFTAVAYEQFAEIYAHVLSNYIASKPNTFRDVAFIPYD